MNECDQLRLENANSELFDAAQIIFNWLREKRSGGASDEEYNQQMSSTLTDDLLEISQIDELNEAQSQTVIDAGQNIFNGRHSGGR